MAAHEFGTGANNPPQLDRRSDDVRFIKVEHTIDRLGEKVADLHQNHLQHKKELSDLSQAVTRLSNTINRAIWVLVGGAAVIAFLSSGQFTQTVKVGQAVAEAQDAKR